MTTETHLQSSHLDQADAASQEKEQNINAIIKDVDLITTETEIEMKLVVEVNPKHVNKISQVSVIDGTTFCLKINKSINVLEALKRIGFDSLKEAMGEPIQLVISDNELKIKQIPGRTEYHTVVIGVRNYLGTQVAYFNECEHHVTAGLKTALSDIQEDNKALYNQLVVTEKRLQIADRCAQEADKRAQKTEDKAWNLEFKIAKTEQKLRSTRSSLANYKGQVKKLKQELAVWQNKEEEVFKEESVDEIAEQVINKHGCKTVQNKIQAIKELRDHTGLSLAKAKDKIEEIYAKEF